MGTPCESGPGLPDRRAPASTLSCGCPTRRTITGGVGQERRMGRPEGMVGQMNEIAHTHDNVFLLLPWLELSRRGGSMELATGTNGKGGWDREGLTAVFPSGCVCQLHEFSPNHIAPLPSTNCRCAHHRAGQGHGSAHGRAHACRMKSSSTRAIEVIPEKFKVGKRTGYTNPATDRVSRHGPARQHQRL